MNENNRCEMTLTFIAPSGEPLTMCIPVDEIVAADIEVITPPSSRDMIVGRGDPLDICISVLRKKQFRKDLFIKLATNLGASLAERMEDAEGWYDASRIEPAKRSLRNRS